jgi:tetratricopeptide (TPR) repeat protein
VTTRTRTLTAVLGAALAACAGSPPRPDARPAAAAAAPAPAAKAPAKAASNGKPAASAAAAPAAELSPKAQRLFDEAVRAEEDQRKLKVPTDWAYLERKWRAVLDAGEVAEARYNLGVALEAQGRLGEARVEYERARQAKPELRQAAVNLGVVLEKQGDVRAAAAAYQRAVQDFPEDAVSRERLAELYRAAGQHDEAWRLAREALVRDPRSVVAHKVLAQVALQRNELDLAKLVALRAQKLDANDPELFFLAGQIAARQGDEAAAAAAFRKALGAREGFLPAHRALLEAAVKQQAWGGVAEHAAAVLQGDPANASVELARGIALRHLGKADEALQAYERAEKLSGGRLPEVHLARGVLYARVKGECEPALSELRAYQRAVPIVPDAAQVTKLVRECEAQLEENRKAVEAARQMQEDAQREAAKAGKETKAPADGSGAPTPAPIPAR